jgi:hypothetical protein
MISFIEKINALFPALMDSLPGSKSLKISIKELEIKLNEKEKNKTSTKVFHQYLAGAGGFKLFLINVFLSKCVKRMPNKTLTKILSIKTTLSCFSSTYANKIMVKA